jgi:bifunctional DNA-binding transcriptional regulator/antitoxin component of YhaV-PrlF toxin-antitoxin module
VATLVREPLPLPSLVAGRTSTVVYGLAAIDDRGRVADRVVLRSLGWSAGLRLDIRETAGVLTVTVDSDGGYQITNQGNLRLPAPLRHRCGLAAGDRVLLAADPDLSRLAIYPPAALDNALAVCADAAGGEPA